MGVVAHSATELLVWSLATLFFCDVGTVAAGRAVLLDVLIILLRYSIPCTLEQCMVHLAGSAF
jgi:hypothetical protein